MRINDSEKLVGFSDTASSRDTRRLCIEPKNESAIFCPEILDREFGAIQDSWGTDNKRVERLVFEIGDSVAKLNAPGLATDNLYEWMHELRHSAEYGEDFFNILERYLDELLDLCHAISEGIAALRSNYIVASELVDEEVLIYTERQDFLVRALQALTLKMRGADMDVTLPADSKEPLSGIQCQLAEASPFYAEACKQEMPGLRDPMHSPGFRRKIAETLNIIQKIIELLNASPSGTTLKERLGISSESFTDADAYEIEKLFDPLVIKDLVTDGIFDDRIRTIIHRCGAQLIKDGQMQTSLEDAADRAIIHKIWETFLQSLISTGHEARLTFAFNGLDKVKKDFRAFINMLLDILGRSIGGNLGRKVDSLEIDDNGHIKTILDEKYAEDKPDIKLLPYLTILQNIFSICELLKHLHDAIHLSYPVYPPADQ